MLFNCVGWIWKRTRLAHLFTVTLTSLSWFVLGIWYGWGYCLCTDWHWQVRTKLGYSYDHSYTHLLILEMTGIDLNPQISDLLTVGVLGLVAVLTIVLNVRDFWQWRENCERDSTKPPSPA